MTFSSVSKNEFKLEKRRREDEGRSVKVLFNSRTYIYIYIYILDLICPSTWVPKETTWQNVSVSHLRFTKIPSRYDTVRCSQEGYWRANVLEKIKKQ